MGAKTKFQRAVTEEVRRINWRLIVAPMVFALGLILLGFALYQMIGGANYRSRDAQLETEGRAAAGSLSGALASMGLMVNEAAQSPELLADVLRSTRRARQQAATRVGRDFPDALRVVVMPPAIEHLEPEPFPGLGYSPLSLMLSAKESGRSPPPAVTGTDTSQPRVNFVAPVLNSEQNNSVIGFLLVTRPLSSFDQALRSIDNKGIYLDLRSNWLSGSDAITNYGTVVGVLDINLKTETVANTSLRVGYFTPRPFGIWDKSTGLNVFTLLLGLAAMVGGLWIRRQPEQERASGEQVLADLTNVDTDDRLREKMEFAEKAKSSTQVATVDDVDPSIFRAYDIRGVVGDTLTPSVARAIGQAIGSEAIDRGIAQVVVGRDGRLSGPELSESMIDGLTRSGVDVVDIGAVPTGVLYYATHALKTGSGVMVTGSHNPPDYNGFKIMLGGDTLAAEQIQALYERIAEPRLHTGKGGLQEMDLAEDYVERIASDVQVMEPLKVVVDAGNGIAGELGPRVLEEIGCEVITLHCEVDGTFPNHHPDPSVPENLQDLISVVAQQGADVGVAFDGDGDRLGVVTAEGEMIFPDRLMILFARDVLMRNPGANIIYDVKCTGHLASEIVSAGGSPIMWKTGHSLIKAKMKETNAELAGEMSGHFFFKERWYGFDDGIYAAARLLEILALDGEPVTEVLAELPTSYSTPELKIAMAEGEHYAFVERFQREASFPEARTNNIDGIRADFDDGWGLLRCSNTTPNLVLRFDADTPEALERIKDQFRAQILSIRDDLELPF